MKIGIYGGSFNPPHKMHKYIAKSLIDNGYLDKVIYVITGDNYNKANLINYSDRFNMVNLMIKDENDLLLMDIGNNSDFQYTYQVLDYLQTIYKDDEIYFICGSDNLQELDTWKSYQYILQNYKLLVVQRNNDNMDKILSKYNAYQDNINVVTKVDSDTLSSTLIRKLLSDNSNEVNNYVDESVYSYIVKNSLYESEK